jgi:hypothetical protein
VFVYFYITSAGNFYVSLGWSETVHLVRRSPTGILYQPRMIVDECGAVGGMKIGRETELLGENLPPVQICPPHIPHDLTWARTRATEVGSRRLAS